MKTTTEADTKIIRGSRRGVYSVLNVETSEVLSRDVTHLQALSDAAYQARRLADGWAPSYEDVDGEQVEA